MTTPAMTDEDAAKLFAQVSEAMQKEDSAKLSDLMAQESPVEEQPAEDTPVDEPEEEEETTQEEESVEEVESDDSEENEEESADEKAADKNKKQDDQDPLAKLQAQLDELKKQQQTFSSQAGRVPSIQRRLAEYDRQLRELANKSTSSKTTEKVKPKIEEALAELKETDPALAKTIEQVMEQALTGVDSDSNTKEIERLTALRDIEYAEYQEEQRNILLTKFPNAPQVFGSQHWADWKKSQPKHIVDLATSDSADAVIMALELYRNEMLRQHPELAEKAKEEPAKEDEKVNERARQVEEERKKQQQRSVNLESGKPPARAKDPQDPEALFKKFSDEIRKDITGK